MDDLKPRWRVNRKPRFSVLEMGEYMAADDGPRETILRNMKYERIARTLIYRNLYQAVSSYLASPTRDRRILTKCRALLEDEIAAARNPGQIENLTYELRALDAFERSLNALAIGGWNLERVGAVRPLTVEKVEISVRPTVYVRATRPRGCDLLGALVIDLAKGSLPKTDEAQARLTNAMQHAAILLHQHVTKVFDGDAGRPSPQHTIVFHTHRSESVPAPWPYRKLFGNVEAVCRNIARGWDNILPPANFDRTSVTYRG